MKHNHLIKLKSHVKNVEINIQTFKVFTFTFLYNYIKNVEFFRCFFFICIFFFARALLRYCLLCGWGWKGGCKMWNIWVEGFFNPLLTNEHYVVLLKFKKNIFTYIWRYILYTCNDVWILYAKILHKIKYGTLYVRHNEEIKEVSNVCEKYDKGIGYSVEKIKRLKWQ